MSRKTTKVYSNDSLSKLNNKLYSYDTNKNSDKTYYEVCEKCGNQFTFTNKDVKDRTFKCPKCGYTMAFFYFKYN